MYYVKTLLRTQHPKSGVIISTMELSYWRWLHSEIMTHRDRARNARSNRATPFSVCMTEVETDPAEFLYYVREKKGMIVGQIDQLEEKLLNEEDIVKCKEKIKNLREFTLHVCKELQEIGLDRSLVNRFLEPHQWIKVVMTATSWKNFFKLRIHGDSEPHFQRLATDMKRELDRIDNVNLGYVHLPYIVPLDYTDDVVKKSVVDLMQKISSARCARVAIGSLKTKERNCEDDLKTFERLHTFGHWSPLEHPNFAGELNTKYGCMQDWIPYRLKFTDEYLSG